MNNKIDLSIIIPCRNLENYITPLLESFKKQIVSKYKIEYIFVLDDCVDNTKQIIEMSNLENYSIISCQVHAAGLARNIGLKQSRGDYIWFIDGDDWLLQFNFIDNLLDTLTKTQAVRIKIPFTSNENFKIKSPVMVWQYIFLKSFIMDILFDFKDRGEDVDFISILVDKENKNKLVNSCVELITEPIYFYNFDRPGSIMNNYYREHPEERFKNTGVEKKSFYYSWVTYLSNNEYLPMVMMLKHSLNKVNSKYPLTCVIIKNSVSEENIECLKKYDIKVIEKATLNLNSKLGDLYNDNVLVNWQNALSKPIVFGLEEFDKCVYLDADMYFYKNADDLFEHPHWSSCIDCWGVELFNSDWLYPGDNYFKMFNAGLIVYIPDKNIVNNYIQKTFELNTEVGIRWADEGILHLLYPNWRFDRTKKLSIYNDILMGRLDDYMRTEWFNPEEIRIAHFSHKKPFLFTWEELINGAKRSYWMYYCLEYVKELNKLTLDLCAKGIVSPNLKIIN